MPIPTIDPETFSGLREAAGAEFVAELVATFCEEAPQMLAELRASSGDHSADRVRRAAHSLKSNSLTFGATALAGLARDLELSGLPQDPSTIAGLEAEYLRVAAALRELCHG